VDLTALPYLGECLSATAPLAWAVAVILFRKGGEQVGPVALNLFKSCVGLALLGLTVMAAGGAPWERTAAMDMWILAASGVIGVALADTLFFYALNALGASRMAVVGASYTPIVIALSFVFLGDRFGPLQWLGTVLVVSAVVLASLPEAGEEGAPQRRRFLVGAALGVASLGAMAVGVVMSKGALDRTPVAWAATVRLAGGVAVMLVACALMPGRREYYGAFLPSGAWKVVLPGSIIGTYIAYMLWLGGIKYTAEVSTAAILNQLHVIYTVLLAAWWLREGLTARKLIAVALGVGGSVLVVLGAA
jgi:drug/metabolite transporter (DMT)-like permease